MTETNCCPVTDLQWTQRVIDNQWADVYFCASCGHVHRTEKYAFPLRFPYNDRCVNCTGDLQLLQPEMGTDPRNVACTNCGMTPIAYDIALAKLRSLAAGAALARKRL